MAPSAVMNRRRISAVSTSSSLSRNSGVPLASEPGTMSSDNTRTVASWCASKKTGVNDAGSATGVCAAAACAMCCCTGCPSAITGDARPAPMPAASD